MMRTTLLLDLIADSCPNRIGWSDADANLSFEQMRSGSQRFAHVLTGDEVRHLAFVGLNGPEMPMGLFAAGYAGLPFVPVNYRLPDAGLRRLLARTAPALAIVDDEMMARVQGIDGVRVMARSEFRKAYISTEAETTALPEPDESADVAILLFTSGTTGEPKAAVLRHGNLTSYVMSTVDLLGAEEDEVALVSVPPYHIAAISAVLTSAYSGRRIVYLSSFTAEDWVDLAAREHVTHAMLVPTMLDRILDVLATRGERLPALAALSYGGGRMPEAVVVRALTLLPHVDFVNAYGLTETSSTIALLGPEDHRVAIASSDPAVRRRLGSVGRPLPSVELQIRDDAGAVLGAGEKGEIHVRGEQVSGEYLHKKATDTAGWFATNDAGWLDADGYLYVDGRLDDVIVRGGENISPGEIEDVLREHKGVADVAVLGLPDDRWGERIVAVVVSRDGNPPIDDLDTHVRGRLKSTKTPQDWYFRDVLPYNETGKLLRRILKESL